MASRPDNTIPAGGSETGATFGAALLFLIRERGRLCHAGELWRWRRDQGKRQERATAPQAEAGGIEIRNSVRHRRRMPDAAKGPGITPRM